MPEPLNTAVGMIEMDVPPSALYDLESASGEHPRLKTTPAAVVTVERIIADVPRLSGELRAELRRFLEQVRNEKS